MNFPNTGMVVVTDLVDSLTNIHPSNKHDVGLRLANWALAETYKQEGLIYKSPMFKSKTTNKNSITLSFDNVYKGLVANGKISGFFISGEKEEWYPAEARIEKDKIILSNENVGTICSLFQNFTDVEKYIRLSGTTLKPETGKILGAFKSKYNNLHCRIGCNSCEASCPHHLPVNTILRYNYYFQSKKQEKIAIEMYKDLPGHKPDICLGCEGHCENACPHGVLARPMLAAAHRNLSFNSPEFT